MKRILVVLVLASLLAFGAPSLLAASQVTVTVMYNNNEFSTDLAKQFEAANPDIKLVMLETDTARYMAMSTAGNPPDIMRCNAAWIPYLVAHKMVRTSPRILGKPDTSNKTIFCPSSILTRSKEDSTGS